VLDVVTDEPLQPPHPIWSHQRVTVTPHIAATPLLDERARQLVAMIRTIDAGGEPKTMVNRDTGY